jgi:hypothetical protein
VVSRPPAIEDNPPEGTPHYAAEEAVETHASLREKQQKMEQKVYRIWTHLSSFEESSAACISDMLRHVSAGNYLDAIRMAEKFILHVEVLFAAIDDLEACFAQVKNKGKPFHLVRSADCSAELDHRDVACTRGPDVMP